MKACTGHCRQGRLPCNTPQACELPTDDDEVSALADIADAIVGVLAAAVCVMVLGALVAVVTA